MTISEEDKAAVVAELASALPAIRERLQYIAAAAGCVILARVCSKVTSQAMLAREPRASGGQHCGRRGNSAAVL